ncbi:NACHT domain-containing protein [Xanthomonas sacchari]|uniref:NACHT domain-containing protein n=1 Tax=Xanthomonas sacchari TaxID=56458 RepID=UPI000A8F18F0|nr:NACHT domain-containing protein [Xanthomonas sacchari]
MITREEISIDLLPFCDIGSGGPKVTEKDGKISAKMTKDSRQLSIVIDQNTSRIQVSSGTGSGQKRYFSSFSSMLADDLFANLRRWADAQREYLKEVVVKDKDLIPFQGISGAKLVESPTELNEILGSERPSADSAEVLLIDGPAGIGKTTLIEKIAFIRADSFKSNGNPLILHVKSRGRVLSNLQDLMAFSLQTLRLQITYDQVPILVKHGLVILAIDGFDELGDPSGYELAWAQINELVTSVRGSGSLILAGRDTFIGRDRLLRHVKSLRANVDIVNEVTLDSCNSSQAKNWLAQKPEWTVAALNSPAISVLLEDGSYALRPVFLRLLKEQVKPKDIIEKRPTDLASFLVGYMLDREATKFGDAVDNALGKAKVRIFVEEFLLEVAREMADSQSDSVDSIALIWIAETALGSGWNDEIVSLVKNRASVMAFLSDDERPGHKRFSHEQVFLYFLAREAFKSISKSDIPKYVRRNILGTELLKTFGDIALQFSSKSPTLIGDFFSSASKAANGYAQIDRGAKNLGALLLASTPSIFHENEKIGGFQVDDAVIQGSLPTCIFYNMVVHQLDVRGADLSQVIFDSCSFVQVIADDATRFSASFPDAGALILANSENITEPGAISTWIDSHGRIKSKSESSFAQLEAHPAYKLLGKACRLRQYWLRSEGDQHAIRILSDSWWPALEKVLRAHDFLREEIRQASGKSSTFFHIRQAERFITSPESHEELQDFFRDLLSEVS